MIMTMNNKLKLPAILSVGTLLISLSAMPALLTAEEEGAENPNRQQTVKSTVKSLKDIAGQYKELATPQITGTADKIEVIEFFWYGCPHCYQFEPFIDSWLDDKAEYIEFIRMPAILGKDWIDHARAFYVAEKLGVLDKIHTSLFDAIHRDRKKILYRESLRKFFIAQGTKGKDFDQAYESEYVQSKVKEAFLAGKEYQITGVPAVTINGKYSTGSALAGGFKNMIEVIRTLAAKEYQALQK